MLTQQQRKNGKIKAKGEERENSVRHGRETSRAKSCRRPEKRAQE